jgi:hypothetical protein
MRCRRRSSIPGLAALLLALLALPGCDAPSQGERSGEALAPTQSGERAHEILALSDPFERSTRFVALLDRSVPEALPALREALAAAPIDYGEPEIVSFGMWWARFDPEGAFAWLRDDWRGASWPVLVSVFRIWAQAEPEKAFGNLDRIEKPLQPAAISGLVAGWQESGKPGLLEQVRTIPDLANRQQIAEIVARRMVMAQGAEGALRSLEPIDDARFRTILERRIASEAARQGHGASIAAWATPRVTAGKARPSGLPRRIATRWVRRDAEAAWAWLESLPAGDDRDDGVMETFRDWWRFRPAEAVRWIEGQQIEPWLEPALAIYSRSLGFRRPEEALAMLSRFTDEKRRQHYSILVVERWAARNPKAAETWLEGAELPDALRKAAEASLESAGQNPGPPRRAGPRREAQPYPEMEEAPGE